MKLAALDLGSNSFHLLVADIGFRGELARVGSHKDVLRLGAVVQQYGQLSETAFDAALGSVSRMVGLSSQWGAERLVCVATSALRDARNGALFGEACRQKLGVEVQLLSGDEEARLAYLGARSVLGPGYGRVLVVDLGGGSAELAAGEDVTCDMVRSLPFGFLRLERAFPLDRPGGARRLSRYVELEAERLRSQLGRVDALLLSGGTARALARLSGGLGAPSSAGRFLRLCEELAQLNPAQLMKRGADASRAMNLAAGAAVLGGLVAGFGQHEVRISPRGLREGVLLRELSQRAPTRAA
jgi:exopolyphosphatase/guanosine-5'-triphosphate,3'-diphosphate pyrophosphatase